MGRGDNLTILYPSGCKEVTEDVGPDELIRRLKTLAHTLQSMGQDDGAYQVSEYVPLAMHIADDFFLSYPSRDVQLLIACCIADVLRVYAPEAPYKDPGQVKTLFMFLIKQLGGLKDPKDPAFKRYFYLLENLAYVKSFNMCFELEDCQEIFCKLFKLMFNIVNDEHSGKVKSFMLDVLCPLINESDVVSNDLLDIILSNVLEPAKSQRKNAYHLAKELVVKCSDTLEPYIQAFFNHVLILGREEKTLTISQKVYDLIYELNHICPSVLLSVLPQLEFKLKSSDEEERYGSVSLLARMFSEKDSTLALNHRQLWTAFLGRFNDISIKIRTKCVQYSMHFLLNHPLLRKDITDTLKLRQHDSEESVRYEVVMAIVSTAKKDFSIVSDSEDLLNFVKERTLDKKFKIRKEAMCGLAMIYKKHLNSPDVPPATRHAVTWIKDKILHGYYMTSMDDRLLVERLLNTCLVPYQLPPEDRMKKLFYLYASIDDNATKAFIELQKHQLAVRKNVAELIELHRKPQDEERDREIAYRLGHLTKFLPDPLKVQEFLRKFSQNLNTDPQLLSLMETVVSHDVSCKDSVEAVTQILKKLGQPVMTNLYYNTIKMLLERVSSVMVDQTALEALVGLVEGALSADTSVLDSLNLTSDIATEKGLKLLFVLSFVYPAHFLHADILTRLIALLNVPDSTISPPVLSVLTYIGKYKPIGEPYPDLASVLIPICQRFAESGTPKQAKHAVRCLHTNCTSDSDEVFERILEKIKEQLTFDSVHFRTAVVSLGHIAFNMPDKFLIPIKNVVSRKVVKELLMRNQTSAHTPGPLPRDDVEEWIEEELLTEESSVKMEGIKMMARWLLGLKSDVISAQKTFRMLNAFILHKGDLLETGKMLQSPSYERPTYEHPHLRTGSQYIQHKNQKAEMAHLRLSAGAAMLKICEQKGVGDQFTSEQFYNLSLLMNDECPQVRERFAIKLHKGLARGIPHKCLPLDFMGFYALAGLEPDRQLKIAVRQYMMADISKRRDYIRSITMSGGSEKASSQLPHIMPDYMLVFAVPLLAHQPDFKDPTDVSQLTRIRSCLWYILEPLMTKNDVYCFGFYKALIEQMKNHKDAVKPEDEITNQKLWAVCDLAMGLILSKTTSFEMKEFPSDPRIPPMYFKKHEDPNFVNVKSYLPTELQVNAPKGSTKVLTGVTKKTTNTVMMVKSAVLNKQRPEDRVEDEDTMMDEDTSNLTNTRKRSRGGFNLEDELDNDDSTTLTSVLPTPTVPSASSTGPASKRGRIGGAIDAASNRISSYLQKETNGKT
ncbi:sister chromatid cohesion protein PDS5 homolog B-B-like isoform X3 [Homarus americanus]|uniref:sister chromatid cohesion protein PDS5 homolog B-B-like isoform X3 n=1 Tax=Homarus americanus TaxID=6706 RepID=UPI001C4766EE|nr:sister chromatid cohesion protein PDS5 homolog B-B-like isoform X3 [Homarus americanus]